jgi:hypothetical protein
VSPPFSFGEKVVEEIAWAASLAVAVDEQLEDLIDD